MTDSKNADDFEEERRIRLTKASPEERALMSDDDVQAVAIKIVMRYLKEKNATIEQVNRFAHSAGLGASGPAVLYELGGVTDYVVVTSARLPDRATPPEDPQSIIEEWSFLGGTGYWVSVSLAHELDSFDPNGRDVLPLMKGFGVIPLMPPFVALKELVSSDAGDTAG